MKSFCLQLRGFKTLNRTGRATILMQKGKNKTLVIWTKPTLPLDAHRCLLHTGECKILLFFPVLTLGG